MTALARWRRMKEQEEKGPIAKRPNDVRECKKLSDAERFRREIVNDISKKITQIQVFNRLNHNSRKLQNPGLGEFKIRDLNDEINRMLRLKSAWEGRIKELGGMDHRLIL
jgi:pre-mRNA-splicing factor ISY1